MLTAFACLAAIAHLPQDHSSVIKGMSDRGLSDLGAFAMLHELTTQIGPRLSGSPGADRAVAWTERVMIRAGLTNVRLVPCMVPKWVRGDREFAAMSVGERKLALNVCALGGSVGTPSGGVEAEVIEVHSLAEAEALGDRGKGKIVFFNRGFDPRLQSTGAGYGSSVDQRGSGASAAAKSGAVAVLVRSMTLAMDDEPHTGAMRYSSDQRIPAAALGIQSAEKLSAALQNGPVKVRLELNCQNFPDVPSASVVGEIVGSEKPGEVIVLGGHLDSWDLGQGAHDDGAGIVHAIEALRIINVLGLKPKRTIRAVAFMNEENGLRGGTSYAEMAKNSADRHYAAIESDAGGFMPRAFGVTETKHAKVSKWVPYLEQFGIDRFDKGGGGADIGPLEPLGTVLFGLVPDNQRYFDYHHSRNDTIDKVHPRELEFGAIAMAALAWLISEEGLE